MGQDSYPTIWARLKCLLNGPGKIAWFIWNGPTAVKLHFFLLLSIQSISFSLYPFCLFFFFCFFGIICEPPYLSNSRYLCLIDSTDVWNPWHENTKAAKHWEIKILDSVKRSCFLSWVWGLIERFHMAWTASLNDACMLIVTPFLSLWLWWCHNSQQISYIYVDIYAWCMNLASWLSLCVCVCIYMGNIQVFLFTIKKSLWYNVFFLYNPCQIVRVTIHFDPNSRKETFPRKYMFFFSSKRFFPLSLSLVGNWLLEMVPLNKLSLQLNK